MGHYQNKIAALLLLLFLAGAAGCATQSKVETPTAGNKPAVSVSPAGDPKPAGVDPVKAAEAESLYVQGLALYEKYEYREAVANFDRAIAANPENFKVYAAKGMALCFEGDYKTGMSLIQKTLDMSPEYVPAFYDMAMAHKLQNQYDQSLFWFEKTIRSDPSNTWSYYGIATIYADRGNAAEALRYLKKAVELDAAVKDVAKEQDHFARMRRLPEFQAIVR